LVGYYQNINATYHLVAKKVLKKEYYKREKTSSLLLNMTNEPQLEEEDLICRSWDLIFLLCSHDSLCHFVGDTVNGILYTIE
jgi:hypothetical protein